MGQDRLEPIDVARGALLIAMLGVHVVSAHATSGQAAFLQRWLGVFLISSSFVAVSGFVIGARRTPASAGSALRAVDSCVHLFLVMLFYGVVLSLVRHGLARLAGGATACATGRTWLPPTRFDDLGILLPIALVQLLAPLACSRHRLGPPLVAALALGWMLIPAVTVAPLQHGVIGAVYGVLALRTLTPFYTVAYFVALGLAGALLGRLSWRSLHQNTARRGACLAWWIVALGMAVPACSAAALDPVYRLLGPVGGAAATLLYWTLAIAAFLRGFAARGGAAVRVRAPLALLGRNSLLVFVAHDFLLELDTWARAAAGAPKGLGAVLPMFLVDLVGLFLLCRVVEARPRVGRIVPRLLLNRSHADPRARPGVFTPQGALAFTVVLAFYTSAALGRSGEMLVVDDFESSDGCPQWWTFGDLTYTRVETSPEPAAPGAARVAAAAAGGRDVVLGHHLEIRGAAPGTFAHGCGVFQYADIGDRRTLQLDVRGYGPGSGRMKIELTEDDNGNWEIEKDPHLFVPLQDDRFVHQIDVDWKGWRRLVLPVRVFQDDNPNRGNDVFDPRRDLLSGGLLGLQLLFSPAGPRDDQVRIDIDNVVWTP